MRKKILLLVAACTMAVSMAGCGSKDVSVNKDNTKQSITETQKTVVEDKGKSDSVVDTKVTKNDKNDTKDDLVDDDLVKDDVDDLTEDTLDDIKDKNKKPDRKTKLNDDVDDDSTYDLDDNANLDWFNDIYYEIPSDMEEYSRDEDTVVYIKYDSAGEVSEMVTVTVERGIPEGVTKSDMEVAFEKEVIDSFGDDYLDTIYVGTVYDFNEYDYLIGNDVYEDSDVKLYYFCDGIEDYGTSIYIQHIVPTGADFSGAVNMLIDSLEIDYLD